MNGIEEIGCCGAYFRTCREYLKICKGCKPGYLDGSRDLSRAKRKMNKCYLTRGHITCGDCGEYDRCKTIQLVLNHAGYNDSKCKQALEYIRAHGHTDFLKAEEHWTGTYGKYPEQNRK